MAVIWSLYTIGIMILYKERNEVIENDEETKILVSESFDNYGSTSTNEEQQVKTPPEDPQSWSRVKKGKQSNVKLVIVENKICD